MLRRLIAAHVVSLTGNMLTLIAVPLYVLAQTGSAALTGLAGAFATVPVVIGGTLGGVLVDRFGYRRSSVLADLLGAVSIAAIPVLGHTVGLPLWALLALVFCGGLLDTPGQAARNALVPQAAAAACVPVERAAAWFTAAERTARLIGAPMAGLLVVAIGPLNVLAVDAASFVISAAVLAGGARRASEGKHHGALAAADQVTVAESGAATADRPAVRQPGGYARQLAAGLRFAAGEPLLRAVVLVVVVTNFFDAAYGSVLLPVYAQRHLGGAVAFGLLVGVTGGGALLGALVFGTVGHRLPRRRTFAIAFVLAGGPAFFGYALGLPLPVLLAIKLVAGFCSGALNPIIAVVMLERVPPRLRARVFGVVSAGCWAGMPVGSLLAGLAVERLGLTATLMVVGTGYLLITLAPLTGGPWLAMDRPPMPQLTPSSSSAPEEDPR